MKAKLLFTGIKLLLSLISMTAMAQQPKLEWAQRWNSVGNVYESAVAVAVDAEGNSYVTGTSSGNTSPVGLTTIKYSPSGEQLWVKFDGDFSLVGSNAIHIAADNNGGVFVTGTVTDSSFTCPGGGGNCITPDIMTVRYDAASGERTWASRYGTVGDNDFPSGIAVDNQGGVYITGSSSIFDVPANFATVRYDAATGEQIWVSRYDGPDNSLDIATDISLDSQGGVYVVGNSYSSDFSSAYIVVVRYNAVTGEQVWFTLYDEAESNETASAITVDNQGGVYFTGSQTNSDFTVVDYVTVRLEASSGDQVWASNFGGANGSFESAIGIAVDNEGGVYVAGNSINSDFTNADYAIVRYDVATGIEAWAAFYNSAKNSFDQATALAVDAQGGVFVTGNTNNSEYNNQDYATIRYNAVTGEETWIQTYDGPRELPNESPDLARDIAVDNQGGVVVTGESYADFGTVRYNATTGEKMWAQQYNVRENLNDYAVAVAVDAEGNSYVTGTRQAGFPRMVTVKYSPTGEELWVAQHDLDRTSGIAVDNKGGVYVTGVYFSLDDFAYDYATIRYDGVTGEQTWVSYYDGPAFFNNDEPSAITVDNAGGVFVTGFSYNEDFTADYATVRYDAATGEQTWASRYNGPDGATRDSAAAIAVDNEGGVYVTGASTGESTSTDFATVRYEASTGEESWVSRYSRGGNTADFPTAIAADLEGGVYVTGSSSDDASGFDYATVRYEASTGMETWASHYNRESNSEDRARDIAVDHTGGVYVTGTSSFNGTGADFTTLRYEAATGEQSWASSYDGPISSGDTAAAIVVDSKGGVYVTGVSYNSDTHADFATVRYDAATGEQVWAERYNSAGSSEDVAVDMALGSEGDLIITGYSYSPETLYDFLTVKYSQCPAITETSITGSTNAAVGTSNSVYSLPASMATSYTWTITDIDGSAYTDFTGQGTGSISVDWPDEPHVYKMSVTYSGKVGCPSQTAVLYAHVYDFDAGFVSGGGRSDSPSHTDYELMQRGGNIYWGFVAKYRTETQVIGSALVILEAGPSIFRSTSIKDGSLVISGNRAFFRGKGVLLHQRGFYTQTDDRQFGYLIAATDGQFGSNTGPDQLRLKIWVINEDGTEGKVVYDNQTGCLSASLDNNAPACDAIERGAIIIHKPLGRSLSSVMSQRAVEQPTPQGLLAYPTAFSDRTTLSFVADSDTNYTLELYDLKGALVQRIAAGPADVGRRYEHELLAEGLSKGLYLVRLNTGDKVETVKLVVER
ncbi:SBBP repeat-containing protein [Pontibacter pamirensis]|uniref:SBBP repeat-containing protein n=1 Tax=Pontibacter pamirensis TaxID=2562824 RepID=UPI001389DD06|nr:SBBP repeat-containing protein [Pontibacter pamirensis]